LVGGGAPDEAELTPGSPWIAGGYQRPTRSWSLLFNEVRNKIGSTVQVRTGAPLPYAARSNVADRKTLLDRLRRATYDLGRPRGLTFARPARKRSDLIGDAERRVAAPL
jgi:hypothetical protein